ncbi:MAG TPA: hypothetical protein VKV74_08180 [Bryobacteraceae bacterium]|nr:hypothetical protein [Bryobacteraceae bacterium]
MAGSAAVEPVFCCAEKKRLRHALRLATLDYSRAALVLQERLSVMKKDDYWRIRNYVDAARIKVEAARRALEGHTLEHGC